MSNETVIVAMSGGVDSSIAAALLLEQGYRVAGVTMRLWDSDFVDDATGSGQPCRVTESIHSARAVCEALGVPHHVLDLRDAFENRVMEYFVTEYRAGRTPNPCVRCNATIKWKELLNYAQAHGADYIATGHYARLQRTDTGAVLLLKGLDQTKDQSYALWAVPQAMLRMTLLPLGGMAKDDTRRRAAALGLASAERAESQDVCFIPDGDYSRFLRDWYERTGTGGEAFEPGDIRNSQGEVIGQHGGVAHFTIGQRKGLGIAVGRPQFVTRIDAPTRTVWVGEPDALLKSSLVARDANWTLGEPPASGSSVQAQIRYNTKAAAATVEPGEDGTFRVEFHEPQRAITPGQSVVLYDGDVVLGGGIIDRAG